MLTNQTKIPGYSGHIPTKMTGKGLESTGVDLPPSLRFTTTSQATYVDQMQYKDPLDDIVAPSTDNQIPLADTTKFYGGIPDDEETFAQDAEVFYDDGTLYHEKLERQKETLNQASSKFHDNDQMDAAIDPTQWDTLPLSYQEARDQVLNK